MLRVGIVFGGVCASVCLSVRRKSRKLLVWEGEKATGRNSPHQVSERAFQDQVLIYHGPIGKT